jgi:methyl-accepting chemotaxis protein
VSARAILQGFQPAAKLMGRLRYAKKFVLIGLVLLAPLAYVGQAYLGDKGAAIEFNAKERVGVEYVGPTATLLGDLVRLRTVAVLSASGDAEATTALASAKEAVAKDIVLLAEVDSRLGGTLRTTEQWTELKGAIEKATATTFAASADASAAYNPLTEGARNLIVTAGNYSNLILDPDLDSYYLMDNVINKLPQLGDDVGRAGDLQVAGSATATDFAVLSGTVKATVDLQKAGFDTAFGNTGDGGLAPALTGLVDSATSTTDAVLKGLRAAGEGSADAKAASAGSAAAAGSVFELYQASLPRLDSLIEVRIDKMTAQKRRVILGSILGALLAIYFFVGFYLSVRSALAGIRKGVGRIGEGDLTADFSSDHRDENADISAALQEMVEKLRVTVGGFASGAGRLGAASQQIASMSGETDRAMNEITSAVAEVSEGAERQVRAVVDVQQVTKQISSAAQAGHEDAQQTADAARQARSVSEEGASAVEQATAAMGSVRDASTAATSAIRALGEKSEQIGGIVETITGIASQTNLLALNAAIEAARAGEQGRGFAVVAEEVRKLAEECRKAAASIAGLITEIQGETARAVEVVEDGARKTEEGSSTVEQARDAFLRIGTSVADVNERIEHIAGRVLEIAESAQRMEQDIVEVTAIAERSSASVQQVSASTQQTSASTQQFAACAEDLARTAVELEQLASQFTLGGSTEG